MVRYSNGGLLDLTSQQILMSPGDLLLKFSSQSRYAGVAFLYLILTTISPAQELEFTNQTYTSNLAEITELIESNRNVIEYELDIPSIRRQLILSAANQNSEFVDSNIEEDDFPSDGSSTHIGG